MAYAIIFPGQGAQEVGMGKEFFDEFKEAREVLELADEALSFRLSRLIFEGPEAELQKTEFTQPAIMAVSIASFNVFSSLTPGGVSPLFVAGHSLGEYTALVAAQALSLEEGLRLVRLRGQLMQEAVPVGEGAMAAIIGLEESVIVEICKAASKGGKVCEVANYNSAQQLVISGHAAAVAEAMEAAKKAGAKRAVPLRVSAPFHCSLMRPVADTLSRAFEACSWRRPIWPSGQRYGDSRDRNRRDSRCPSPSDIQPRPVEGFDSIHGEIRGFCIYRSGSRQHLERFAQGMCLRRRILQSEGYQELRKNP